MTNDIYGLLNIVRTDNFAEVERAYLSKVQSFSAAIADTPSVDNKIYLEDLKIAWKKVNGPEKLHYFFINNHFLLDFPKPEEISLGEEINVIYIPVFLEEGKNSEEIVDTVLKMERLTDAVNFQEVFNYERLAQVLTNKSKLSPLLVGITVAEAERIYELHVQLQFAVIAEVSILPHQLSNERYCERDIYSEDEGRTAPYFCLAKGCVFQTSDIISVCPIELYEYHEDQNNTDLRWLWPKVGGKYIAIKNPEADFPLQFASFGSQEWLPLTDLNQNKQIKKLKQAVAAIKKYSQELASEKDKYKKDSKLSHHEVLAMSHLSQELDEELQLFIRDTNSTKLTLPAFSGALVYFKDNLNARLDKYDAEYHSQDKKVVPNILIALTGVGLLALLPKLAYSYYTTGKAEGFFTQTEARQKLEYIRHTLNDLSLNEFIKNKEHRD
ncbi:MAG: hypothetical protein QM652_03600 [Legionella sp.]|uniref:hypothetical protein n=1 Tax=Legionella sp. TaxID=459 RepID=UPI0039E48C61